MADDRHALAGASRTRYEFRVWGRHRKARKVLARLADRTSIEVVDDCYLLTDDPRWNVKVRGGTLKLKRLVTEDKGFERWAARRFRNPSTAPEPFDEIFDALDLDIDGDAAPKPSDVAKAVRKLDASLGVRAVRVRKHRTRYGLDGIRAEVTDIDVVGSNDVLRCLVIEGDDLDELKKLRKALGLHGQPNVAVHQALDGDT